jgi:hypothetical protein
MLQSPTTAVYLDTVRKVTGSETFSKSKIYQQLLQYLAEQSLQGETPKETVIAMEVFDKDASFNPAESTLVRVTVYNLRKKLSTYYLTEGKEDDIRIKIPKGNYKVEFVKKPAIARKPLRAYLTPVVWVVTALLLISLAANYWLWQTKVQTEKAFQPVPSHHPLWENIFTSPKPVLIVLGDLFIFQEYSEALDKIRVVRDMNLNSEAELTEFLNAHPDFETKITETNYTHLIKNNAFCLKDIVPVLVGAQKEFDIQVMSRLTSEDLQRNNIIFIGLFKTMGLFGEYFQASHFEYISEETEQLRFTNEEKQTVKTYALTGSPDALHTDYGLVAKFPGPQENTILIFAGFHDTGVLQSVKNLTHPTGLDQMEKRMRTQYDSVPTYFEMLFRAKGIDRTEFETEIVHLQSLPPDTNIWNLSEE